VRRILDRQARQALAEAIAERVRIESRLDDLRAVRRLKVAGMARLQSEGAIDARHVLLQEADLVALDRRAQRLALDLEESAQQERKRMSALADARRDLEVVRNLRSRALSDHREACQKEEIADLDEHTGRRHAVARFREIER
jgi:flagellar export protein FliJ